MSCAQTPPKTAATTNTLGTISPGSKRCTHCLPFEQSQRAFASQPALFATEEKISCEHWFSDYRIKESRQFFKLILAEDQEIKTANFCRRSCAALRLQNEDINVSLFRRNEGFCTIRESGSIGH